MAPGTRGNISENGGQSFAIDRAHATSIVLRAFTAAMDAPIGALLACVRVPGRGEAAALALRGLLTTPDVGPSRIRSWNGDSPEPRLPTPAGSILGSAALSDEPVVGRVPTIEGSDASAPNWWVLATGMSTAAGDRGVLYVERDGAPSEVEGLRAVSRAFAVIASLCLLDPAMPPDEQALAAARALREARFMAWLANPVVDTTDPFGSMIREMGTLPAPTGAVDRLTLGV
jgi:hypothetical protein